VAFIEYDGDPFVFSWLSTVVTGPLVAHLCIPGTSPGCTLMVCGVIARGAAWARGDWQAASRITAASHSERRVTISAGALP
jgi:hypothetical protein